MGKYLRKYWIFALLAPIFMAGEVLMDLVQPRLMSTIVDEGALDLKTETRIYGALKKVYPDTTKIIIERLQGFPLPIDAGFRKGPYPVFPLRFQTWYAYLLRRDHPDSLV